MDGTIRADIEDKPEHMQDMTPEGEARRAARERRKDQPAWRRYELPTWGVVAGVYGGWALLTIFWPILPWWVLLPLSAWTLAWFMSLQHELLHGHPTRSAGFNEFLGGIPINLWLPYRIYRDTHLTHHNNENLTDPILDPESYYVTPEEWGHLDPVRKALLKFRMTSLGRLTLGPAMMLFSFYKTELMELLEGDFSNLKAWALHLLGLVPVLLWLFYWQVPLGEYLLIAVYPSISLAMVRSYAEHKADEDVEHRTAIVEASMPMRLLFLNNNYHWVHHEWPAKPWYDIPDIYREKKDNVLEHNGHYYINGYGRLLGTHLLKGWDKPVRPMDAVGEAE